MAFCTNCGSQLPENSAFCINCGAPVAQQAEPVNQPPVNETAAAQAAPESTQAQGTAQAEYQQAQYSQPNQQNYYAQQNVAPNFQQPAPDSKSAVAAGILGILLGAFGVHNFYLGFTGKAVAQLLITCLSCGALSPVSAIWGLVEGIMILVGNVDRDAKGIPLDKN